ncbi:MAG: PAS domain-containing sensor histidine kinase [Promethearchaeota archaeon]
MHPEKMPFDTNLLDKIPAGIVILDRFNKNKPVFANKKVKEDLHLNEEQELSKEHFLAFLDPSVRQKFIDISNSDLIPEISEWKSTTLAGKPTWMQLRISPLDDNYYIVIIRNIGKIKEILDKVSTTEAQYQALVENDPNFLFILKNGILEYYNHAFIEKLGYTFEEIEKYSHMPTFFVAPEHREKIARFLLQSKRNLITGKIPKEKYTYNRYQQPDENTEFELLCKDGSRIPIHAIVRRVYSEKDVIVQGVLIDLSAIKELQDMKLDFLTMTQHQLRTPIVNLKGYLDYYKKQINKGISLEDKQALESKLIGVFSRNIDQMESLTKDLNDVALIRRGKLKCNLRGENFNPIIQQVIEDLEFLLRKYRVDLIVQYPSTPYIVNLDRNRISQAIRNVLENAIRFTGHGVVEINISVTNEGQNLKFTVKDSGVGIESSNLENVGKPFRTFHPSASRLGLGLYLTKEIITAHDGSLEITSSGYNQGTTVSITLPLLVSPEDDITSSKAIEDSSLNEIIKIATTSENILKRMDALHHLGNGTYSDLELDKVISALEKIILYDNDRIIRNLAGQFYSEKVEVKKNASTDVF